MSTKCIRICLTTIVATLLLMSCGDSGTKDHADAVVSLTGKQVVIPATLDFIIQSDKISPERRDADYRVVTYVEADECTQCRIKVSDWTRTMAVLNSFGATDVDLLMIVNTDNPRELAQLLTQYNFNYPVAIDSTAAFHSSNPSIDISGFDTFLLDYQNRIVAIGNPMSNLNIRKLYADIISDAFGNPVEDNASAPMLNPHTESQSSALGVVRKHESKTARFILKNTGDSVMAITKMLTSCNCVSAFTEADTIAPHKSVLLYVRYTGKGTDSSFRQVADVFIDNSDTPLTFSITGYELP